MVRAVRRTLLPLVGMLLACSSKSGIASDKSLASLTTSEYVTVCNFFNDTSQSLVGQTCSSTQRKIVHVMHIDCGRNPFEGSMCTATVADVEACVSKTDVCGALRDGARPAECSKIAQCVGGGS